MGTFGRISALILTVSIGITIFALCTAKMDSYVLLSGQRSERKNTHSTRGLGGEIGGKETTRETYT